MDQLNVTSCKGPLVQNWSQRPGIQTLDAPAQPSARTPDWTRRHYIVHHNPLEDRFLSNRLVENPPEWRRFGNPTTDGYRVNS
ncbi:unnamed protein product [Oppiella nova]|uniref:Uncharacterized protein n=1 Tax=Oppiella nova TaxID=334625 RepID=A0A7R9QYF2_9ACAR|nr:unnamed protein product [Oppiella nova]CAG2178947.1 unnamed protein product [Oppiella nova]